MKESRTVSEKTKLTDEVFGKRVGLLARMFGCYHRRMSRPVTTGNLTYQYCPACGIRRKYDAVTFTPERELYYPANETDLHHV